MHKIKRLLSTIILSWGMTAPVLAEELFMISHPGVSLTREDIREIFLGEKQFTGSVKIVPVDNRTAQTTFLSNVVKIDSSRYNTNWTKKGFRDGLAQPVVKSGDAEVINFIKSTTGAVGYVKTQPRGVAVIER